MLQLASKMEGSSCKMLQIACKKESSNYEMPQKVCNMEGSGFKMLCIAYKRKVPPPNNVANGMQSAKFQLPNAAHSMENKHSQESLK
jgi:hypothetical protein